MKFYHATPYENLADIASNGIRIQNYEGLVYLCENQNNCLKFMLIRGIIDVLVCEIDIPKSWVIETFEHAESVFKCRCFGSTKPIPANKIKNYYRHDLSTYFAKLHGGLRP